MKSGEITDEYQTISIDKSYNHDAPKLFSVDLTLTIQSLYRGAGDV